jgi:tetratricopeptide (TPR) repeat protein
MKMRNQHSKPRYDTKIKRLTELSLKRGFVAFYLTFMALCLLTFITDMACAKPAMENSQTLPQTIPVDPNHSQRLDLLRAEMSSPEGREGDESKSKLKQMIERVRSVRFESQAQDVNTPVVRDKVPVPEPNETLSEMQPRRTKEVEEIEVERSYEQVTDQTLQILKNLLQDPGKLNDPLELGEILYSSGNTEDAVLFYQEALRRTDPNDENSSRDRAWILFQMGNCLRRRDLPAAAKIYGQFLTEHPHAPWTDLANAQGKFIAWCLNERPRELIAELEYAGSQQNRK